MKNLQKLATVSYKGKSISVIKGILGNGHSAVSASVVHKGGTKSFTGNTKIEAVGFAKSFIDKII